MEYMFFSIIIFLAAIIQGMTSFGFSLVALPLLALFLQLDLIVPILVSLSLFLNLSIIFKLKGKIKIKKIFLLLFTGIIFTPLGVKILIFADEKQLKIVVGILLVIASITMLKGYKVNFKNKNLTYVMVGVLSGILNGSLSLSGPPVVVMLASEDEYKDNFRKNLTFYFLCLNIFTIPSFLAKSLLNYSHIKFLSIGVFVMFLGAIVGVKVGNKINERIFKKMILLLIGIMGIVTVIGSV